MSKWRTVVYCGTKFQNYEVNRRGEIRHKISKKVTYLFVNKTTGYSCVMLYDTTRQKLRTVRVHTVVATAWKRARRPGEQIAHWDENKGNNANSNLRYTSNSINTARSFALTCRPRQNGPHLSPAAHALIRGLHATGRWSQSAIARATGISNASVSRIVRGHWASIGVRDLDPDWEMLPGSDDVRAEIAASIVGHGQCGRRW